MSEKKPLVFVNIAPLSLGREEELAAEMVEYTSRTGNRVVLYCLTLHPEGYPATKKADLYIGSYRKLRQALAGTDVQLGVLLQSTMGHWPRTDKNEEDWTRTINIQGNPDRFCSFDERYRDYIRYCITALAKEKPSLVMGDDDLRSFSPYAECFCPLHVAEFNRRTGRNYTADELRQAVRDAREGDEIFEQFLKLQRDTVNGFAKLIRETLDSVDPAIPAACCMPGWEYRFVGETAKTIAARGQAPILRIANANYLEQGPKTDFSEVVLRTMVTQQLHQDIPTLLDEADTCPHNLYARCAQGMHAKLCSSIMCGLTGAKLWFVNASKLNYPINRNYTDILAANRGLYQQLANECADSTLLGPIQPGHFGYEHWTFNENAQFEWPFNIEKNWAQTILGHYGIPFQARFELDKNEIYMLSTVHDVCRFTDDELMTLMKGKVLLDGAAAAELCRRGFAKYIGVLAEDKAFRFNAEYECATKQFFPMDKAGVKCLTVLDKSVKVLTMLAYRPFYGAEDIEDVAPGTTLYENELGGKVAVLSYNVEYYMALYNEMRKDWLVRVMEQLKGESLPYVVENYQDVLMIARRCQDGAGLLAVFNTNCDPILSLKLRCTQKPEKVLQMQPNGTWAIQQFSFEQGRLTLHTPIPCYGVCILKIAASSR